MKRIVTLLALLVTPGLVYGQAPAGLSDAWVVRSKTAKVENFRGRKALRMRSGQAYRTDVQFEDGTIEFDIALTPYPSYVGVIFRVQTEGEQEMIYLRPHKSGQWDAIQYAPLLRGEVTWQLYPDYNAEAELPTDGWLHVKLVVAGPQAALYLGGAAEPTMTLPLQRESKPGYVGFTSGVRPDVAEGVLAGNFANLVVKPGPVTVVAPPAGACATDARLLKRWRLSSAFPKADGMDERALSDGFRKTLDWKTVGCDTNGVVNLTRHLGSPGENGMSALAEVEIRSEREQVKKLQFGYSDDITIYLNGLPLYAGVNGYSSRYPLYLGGVTPEYDGVYLPLRKGSNTLLLVVTEEWGGWGFVCRLEDMKGVQVK
jgi:hypothetical protein